MIRSHPPSAASPAAAPLYWYSEYVASKARTSVVDVRAPARRSHVLSKEVRSRQRTTGPVTSHASASTPP